MTSTTLNNEAGRALAKVLFQAVQTYFQNEEHCKAFEKWYKQTYGKEYHTKTMAGEKR